MSGKNGRREQRYDDAKSSTFHKRLKVNSHATKLSSDPDKLSSARPCRRVFDLSGDGDNGDSDTESSSDSNTNNSIATDDSPNRSSSNIEKQTEEETARNEMQRKKQRQKSDRQRRAKIKDGMEQLKTLLLLHDKLESSDRASLVSATVQLVHASRQELLELKAEVERTRIENEAMRRLDLPEFAGLNVVVCGQLAAVSPSPLGQLTLSQLSSQQVLNSQHSLPHQKHAKSSSISQQQLGDLNTLLSANKLSSFGLPANTQAGTQYQPACKQDHDRRLP